LTTVLTAVGRALHGEALKLKRTLALRMVLVAPTLVALLALLIQSLAVVSGRGDLAATMWQSLWRSALTLWAVFLLPLLITVETALLAGIEHETQQWKHMFALPIPRYAIYVAKLCVAQALVLLSTLLVWLLIVLSGWLLMLGAPVLAAAGPAPVLLIGVRAIECWLAAGLIMSSNFWIALRWPSFTVPLGVGIAGTFFALFATSAEISRYYPWLLPLDALSGPDRLRAALVLGIGGGLIVATLGGVDFVRREESAPPRLGRPAAAVLASLLVAFVATAAYLDRGLLLHQPTPYSTRFVTVERGVRLEVLDWGGTGRPIVLLAGLGDTPHVYDVFASKLVEKYHVYGITRRGFGASSTPTSGYSADRLGDDVVAVIDSLKLVRPVLVGHSIAGEELSSVGSRYPEKVAGLVYLDAGYSYAYYDRTRGDFTIDLFDLARKLDQVKPGRGLRDPRPALRDVVASLPGFEKVLREHLADLDARSAASSPGSPPVDSTLQTRPGLAAASAIVAGEEKYTAIPLPVLAIYALPHDMGASNPLAAWEEARDSARITGPQARAFELGLPSARVVRLPHADHYVFQSNESDVLREMNAFIDGLPR